MITTRDARHKQIKRERELRKKAALDAELLSTSKVKLPEREELDSEKIKKTKSITTRDVLPEGWKRKE